MKNSSVFLRIGVFPIMLFCTLRLLVDAWSIYFVINKGLSRITTWWIIFGGIVALFWAGWHARLIYEKVAFYIFGISFFLMDISQFAKKEIMIATMFFCLLLDICGTINFWIGYKKFSQDLDNKANKIGKRRFGIRVAKESFHIVIVILGLLAGLLFGIFGIFLYKNFKQIWMLTLFSFPLLIYGITMTIFFIVFSLSIS